MFTGKCCVTHYDTQNKPRRPFIPHQTSLYPSWAGCNRVIFHYIKALVMIHHYIVHLQITPFQVDLKVAVDEIAGSRVPLWLLGTLYWSTSTTLKNLWHLMWSFPFNSQHYNQIEDLDSALANNDLSIALVRLAKFYKSTYMFTLTLPCNLF